MRRAATRRVVAFVAQVIFAAAAVTACGGAGGDATSARSESDPQPSNPLLRANQRGVELAGVTLDDGRILSLRAYRNAGAPCLILVGVGKHPRGCATPNSDAPVDAVAALQQKPGAPVEVFAITNSDTDAVEFEFAIEGAVRGRRAVLMRVNDRRALRGAIQQGFGYAWAELPTDAKRITARAIGKNGRPVERADFDGPPYGGAFSM